MEPIDILIPVYNSFDWLKQCVDSLSHNLYRADIGWLGNIILTDDESDVGRLEDTYYTYNIKIVRSGERKYFSGNVNYGFQYVESDYFVLMNSDAIITPANRNWLKKFYNDYREDESVGILSPTTATMSEHSPYHEGVEYGHCSGAWCWFMSREFFKKMGGLRTDGRNIHWHSDMDFIDRARKAGYKLGTTCVYVWHPGHKSNIDMPDEIAKTRHQ